LLNCIGAVPDEENDNDANKYKRQNLSIAGFFWREVISDYVVELVIFSDSVIFVVF